MGTNYYLVNETNRCDCCGRADVLESLHIGKSSGGWAFRLRVYPELGINDFDDWKRRWAALAPTELIKDQYGKRLSVERMLTQIEQREGHTETNRVPLGYPSWNDFHRANYSYRGRHNLLFSTYEIVGEGDTYQLTDREFS